MPNTPTVTQFASVGNQLVNQATFQVGGGGALTPEQAERINTITSLSGKTIAIIGDGVMQGNGWIGGFKNLIDESFKNANTMNIAQSGATFVGDEIFEQFAYIYTQRIKPDYIILDGGVNDMFNHYSLGSVNFFEYTDTERAETVIGALEHIFNWARILFPDCKIMFCTTYKLTPEFNPGETPPFDQQKTFWDEIKKACVKYSVPVADFYAESNFIPSPNFIENYFAPNDFLHINELGYRWLWNIFKNRLLNI